METKLTFFQRERAVVIPAGTRILLAINTGREKFAVVLQGIAFFGHELLFLETEIEHENLSGHNKWGAKGKGFKRKH